MLRKITCYGFSIALIVFLFLEAVMVHCFNTNFYETEYAKLNVAEDVGCSFEDLMKATRVLLDYTSDKREDNYIAGLSMGGRGTCVYAFNHPEKFAGAAILSANPSDFNKMKTSGSPMWERMKKSAINFEGGEEEFLNSYQNTVKVLREKVASGVKLPKIFIGAGEEDQMIMKDFPATKELFKELGIDAEYYTVPGLRHEWRYWDMAIEKALDYFGIEKIAE